MNGLFELGHIENAERALAIFYLDLKGTSSNRLHAPPVERLLPSLDASQLCTGHTANELRESPQVVERGADELQFSFFQSDTSVCIGQYTIV